MLSLADRNRRHGPCPVHDRIPRRPAQTAADVGQRKRRFQRSTFVILGQKQTAARWRQWRRRRRVGIVDGSIRPQSIVVAVEGPAIDGGRRQQPKQQRQSVRDELHHQHRGPPQNSRNWPTGRSYKRRRRTCSDCRRRRPVAGLRGPAAGFRCCRRGLRLRRRCRKPGSRSRHTRNSPPLEGLHDARRKQGRRRQDDQGMANSGSRTRQTVFSLLYWRHRRLAVHDFPAGHLRRSGSRNCASRRGRRRRDRGPVGTARFQHHRLRLGTKRERERCVGYKRSESAARRVPSRIHPLINNSASNLSSGNQFEIIRVDVCNCTFLKRKSFSNVQTLHICTHSSGHRPDVITAIQL
jgi:hypothetical protein